MFFAETRSFRYQRDMSNWLIYHFRVQTRVRAGHMHLSFRLVLLSFWGPGQRPGRGVQGYAAVPLARVWGRVAPSGLSGRIAPANCYWRYTPAHNDISYLMAGVEALPSLWCVCS